MITPPCAKKRRLNRQSLSVVDQLISNLLIATVAFIQRSMQIIQSDKGDKITVREGTRENNVK
jgi:hypothetical protein